MEAWAKSKPFPEPEETWVKGSRGEGMKVQFCLSHNGKEVVHTWFETIGGVPDPDWRKGMFPKEK